MRDTERETWSGNTIENCARRTSRAQANAQAAALFGPDIKLVIVHRQGEAADPDECRGERRTAALSQKMLGFGASMKRPLTPRLERNRASIVPVFSS